MDVVGNVGIIGISCTIAGASRDNAKRHCSALLVNFAVIAIAS